MSSVLIRYGTGEGQTAKVADRIGRFGGALRFSEYGFLKRLMMKRIASDLLDETRAPADDVEFTDWDAVDAFAAAVAAFAEGRLGVTPDGAEGPAT